MCFTIDKESNPRPRKAKADIECYKQLEKRWDGECVSPFKNYVYRKDVITPRVKITSRISRIWYKFIGSANNTDYIYEGYHSYKLEKSAKPFNSPLYVVCKFIIPKGTRYYKNEREYVSEQIIFVDEILNI